VVAAGTPETIAATKESYTGKYLRRHNTAASVSDGKR
jgi:excinuclease UvrABC ATPase subunit